MSGQPEKKGYTETAKEIYNKQYENWVPWLEDKYLQLTGKDNKVSYATKRTYPPRSHTTPPPPHRTSPNPH